MFTLGRWDRRTEPLRLCVRGKSRLRRRIGRRHVPCRAPGKSEGAVPRDGTVERVRRRLARLERAGVVFVHEAVGRQDASEGGRGGASSQGPRGQHGFRPRRGGSPQSCKWLRGAPPLFARELLQRHDPRRQRAYARRTRELRRRTRCLQRRRKKNEHRGPPPRKKPPLPAPHRSSTPPRRRPRRRGASTLTPYPGA